MGKVLSAVRTADSFAIYTSALDAAVVLFNNEGAEGAFVKANTWFRTEVVEWRNSPVDFAFNVFSSRNVDRNAKKWKFPLQPIWVYSNTHGDTSCHDNLADACDAFLKEVEAAVEKRAEQHIRSSSVFDVGVTNNSCIYRLNPDFSVEYMAWRDLVLLFKQTFEMYGVF